MVDLVITATSVLAGANATSSVGILGETVTAGQAVYKDANGLWMRADNNSATVLARRAIGVALNGGAINQPVKVQTAGLITIGAALTAGVAYYLSDAPGGICPVADLLAGEFVCLLGIATTTAIIDTNIQFPNVAL